MTISRRAHSEGVRWLILTLALAFLTVPGVLVVAVVWFSGITPGPGFRVSLGFVEDEWRVSSYGSFATG